MGGWGSVETGGGYDSRARLARPCPIDRCERRRRRAIHLDATLLPSPSPPIPLPLLPSPPLPLLTLARYRQHSYANPILYLTGARREFNADRRSWPPVSLYSEILRCWELSADSFCPDKKFYFFFFFLSLSVYESRKVIKTRLQYKSTDDYFCLFVFVRLNGRSRGYYVVLNGKYKIGTKIVQETSKSETVKIRKCRN